MALDLNDQFAIHDLLHRYCHNADYEPPAQMSKMFAADGVFEVPAMDLHFKGVEAIIAFFTASRAADGTARHVISNIVVEGDGDEAQSCAYLQVLGLENGLPVPRAFGRYMDTLRRYPEGWRLQHRSVAMG